MHIIDGLISPSACITGYAITGGLTWYSLKQIKRYRNPRSNIPKASLLTAAFFVSSLIKIPLPFGSIHPIFNGMMGMLLGYYGFLAILIGLVFQAIFFQHGGLSTLGINGVIMGLPAIIAYHLFQLRNKIPRNKDFWQKIIAFIGGGIAFLFSAILFITIAVITISPDLDGSIEKKAIYGSLALITYLSQAIIEGVLSALLISFLAKVKPEMLNMPLLFSRESQSRNIDPVDNKKEGLKL